MSPSNRYAAQGLGIDADLDRAEAAIRRMHQGHGFECCAEEGARLAPQHENTSPPSKESPNPVGAQPEVTEYPPGNTMNVTLGDLGFVWLLGVIFGVVGCLGWFS